VLLRILVSLFSDRPISWIFLVCLSLVILFVFLWFNYGSCFGLLLGVQHELLRRKYDEECALLKKRYLDECSERKRLYNEVIELKGNIRVFCRCRPLNSEEVANGSTSVVDFDMAQENEIQIVPSDSSRKQFRFDHVFKPEDGQGKSFVEYAYSRFIVKIL